MYTLLYIPATMQYEVAVAEASSRFFEEQTCSLVMVELTSHTTTMHKTCIITGYNRMCIDLSRSWSDVGGGVMI